MKISAEQGQTWPAPAFRHLLSNNAGAPFEASKRRLVGPLVYVHALLWLCWLGYMPFALWTIHHIQVRSRHRRGRAGGSGGKGEAGRAGKPGGSGCAAHSGTHPLQLDPRAGLLLDGAAARSGAGCPLHLHRCLLCHLVSRMHQRWSAIVVRVSHRVRCHCLHR